MIAAVLTALLFYCAFIARSAFAVSGQRYFSLFDDAMVSMRYARNLAEGHGLIWNVDGQHVEGYSNFLWTLWMSFLHLLPVPDQSVSLLVMASGAVLLVVAALIVGRIVAILAPGFPWAEPFGVALTALYYPLGFWTLRGMETGLVAVLVSASVLLALRLHQRFELRRLWALGIVMALGVLTRDDVLVPCLVVSAFVVLVAQAPHRRVTIAVIGGLLGGALLGHAVLRLIYYGNLLPNTYYLKLSGIPLESRLLRGGVALGYTFLVHLLAPVLFAIAFVAIRRRTVPAGAILVGAVFLAQCAYSVSVGGDAWESMRYANRYIAPVVPLLLVLALLGTREIWVAAAPGRARLAIALTTVLGAAALLIAAVPLPTDRLEIPPTAKSFPAAVTAAGAAAVLLFLHGALRYAERRTGSHSLHKTSMAAFVLALVVFVGVNAVPLRTWATDNALGLSLDASLTRYGVALRETTTSDTTIAVTSAGAISYFSQRPTIDMLGKSDAVVATRSPQATLFRPGHNKWDYGYSLGELRPGVVAQLWLRSDRDLCALEGWGYQQVAPDVWVDDRTSGVKRVALARAVKAIGLLPVGQVTPARCISGS